jgi:phosphate transport system protein
MTTTVHLDRHLERALTGLKDGLRQRLDATLRALTDAVQSLHDRDPIRAGAVLLQEAGLRDAGGIDEMCQAFLTEHTPAAGDLRFALAATKVAAELGQVASYAAEIARSAQAYALVAGAPAPASLFDYFADASEALRRTVQAFVDGDADAAEAVLRSRTGFERRYHGLVDQVSRMGHPERDLGLPWALHVVVNRMERLVDRTAAIAEDTLFAVRGIRTHHVDRGEDESGA